MDVKVRVKIHARVAKQILTSHAMQADIRDRCGQIAIAANARAGLTNDYFPSVIVGASRARGSVITGTPEAMVEESRHHTMMLSLDEGRW